MYSMQQLIKATAVAASTGGVGGKSSSDLYKFLRQISSGLKTSSSTPKKQNSSQATASSSSAASSEPNFSHNSPSSADGCCHGESESESAQSIKFVQYLQQQHRHIHTQQQQHPGGQRAKSSQQQHQQQPQQTTTKFAMSSLAAEPLEMTATSNGQSTEVDSTASCHEAATSAGTGKKPCFNTGLAEILQFMELIGNLKVLRCAQKV